MQVSERVLPTPTDLADPSGLQLLLDELARRIAAACDIPPAILFGES